MVDLKETLAGLFLEASIIEHLVRTRLENGKYMEGLALGQLGILGYLIRLESSNPTPGTIAWTFQEDEARVFEQIRGLVQLDHATLGSAIQFRDAIVTITPSGRAAHQSAMERMAPDFLQFVEEVPLEELATTHRVLKHIRLVMDNLPDREG